MNALQPIPFQDVTLTVVEHQDTPWLTAEQVGIALGLQHPRQAVTKLYRRHTEEFGAEDSVETKLVSTDGKHYNQRIFSQSGCILLAFFANSPRAVAFRQWAKQALAVPRPVAPDQGQVAALETALLQAKPVYAKIRRYTLLGLSTREVGRLVELDQSTVRDHMRRLRPLGLLPPAPDKDPWLALPLAGGTLPRRLTEQEKQHIQALDRRGLSQRAIAEQTGRSTDSVRRALAAAPVQPLRA